MSSFADLFKPRQQKQELERPIRRFLDEQVTKRAVTVGDRAESRTNLTVAVLVVPLGEGGLSVDSAFPAVTKDFCSTGLSIILRPKKGSGPICRDGPEGASHKLDLTPFSDHAEFIIGLQAEAGLVFAQGHVIHHAQLGGGFSQVGIRLTKLADTEEYPELANLSL